jgi:hypothetical protein
MCVCGLVTAAALVLQALAYGTTVSVFVSPFHAMSPWYFSEDPKRRPTVGILSPPCQCSQPLHKRSAALVGWPHERNSPKGCCSARLVQLQPHPPSPGRRGASSTPEDNPHRPQPACSQPSIAVRKREGGGLDVTPGPLKRMRRSSRAFPALSADDPSLMQHCLTHVFQRSMGSGAARPQGPLRWIC